jgi:hypothetical protein
MCFIRKLLRKFSAISAVLVNEGRTFARPGLGPRRTGVDARPSVSMAFSFGVAAE